MKMKIIDIILIYPKTSKKNFVIEIEKKLIQSGVAFTQRWNGNGLR